MSKKSTSHLLRQLIDGRREIFFQTIWDQSNLSAHQYSKIGPPQYDVVRLLWDELRDDQTSGPAYDLARPTRHAPGL